VTEPIVFIVSEDAPVRQSVKTLVESASLQAATYQTLQALLEAREPESCVCLVFCPRKGTLGERAEQVRLAAACAGRPGILITGRGNVSTAVQALKAGIRDVVLTPYRDPDLLEQILKALEAYTAA
jgi:two-component system, LuxR family, response regulator FixJ